MATRIATSSGNWYSTIWYDPGTNADNVGPLTSGEVSSGSHGEVFVQAQTVTITGANVTSFGTLDNIDFFFTYNGVTAPVLDVTNETFGAGFVLTNNVNTGGGKLIARGTSANAGRIQADNGSVGGALTLDIQGSSFASSGILGATNGGTLVVSGGTLANSGTLLAGTVGPAPRWGRSPSPRHWSTPAASTPRPAAA